MTNGANRTGRDTEVVYKAIALSGDHCYFGNASLAKAWAGRGTVEQIRVKTKSCELAYPSERMVHSLRLVSDNYQNTIEQLTEENTRLSELCDKWNFECDEMREDNKRLADERYELQKALWDARDSIQFVECRLLTTDLSGVLFNAISKIDVVLK